MAAFFLIILVINNQPMTKIYIFDRYVKYGHGKGVIG